MISSEVLLQDHPTRTQSEVVTPAEERRSSPYLTRFEVAKIIAERSKQIINGVSSAPFYDQGGEVHSPNVDPVEIAKLDLAGRRIRMLVKRSWPNGEVEVLPVQELFVDTTMLDL